MISTQVPWFAVDRDDRVQLATLSRVATRAGGELGAAVNSCVEIKFRAPHAIDAMLSP